MTRGLVIRSRTTLRLIEEQVCFPNNKETATERGLSKKEV